MFELQLDRSVATITLVRAPVNAMNDAWVEGFHGLLDELDNREDWSVLRIRSGLKLFSAGADLKQIKSNFHKPIEEQLGPGERYQALFSRIEALSRPTLAEIKGNAFGGGLELALSCDMRVAATETKLGLPEVTLGLIPGAGGTQRLPRLVGTAPAMRMILGGETVTGSEAFAMGLVQWAVPVEEFDSVAEEIVRRLAAMPPHAVQAAKAAIRLAFDNGLNGYVAETAAVKDCLAHARTQELVGAFLARSAK